MIGLAAVLFLITRLQSEHLPIVNFGDQPYVARGITVAPNGFRHS
jgi:hypothetical protein